MLTEDMFPDQVSVLIVNEATKNEYNEFVDPTARDIMVRWEAREELYIGDDGQQRVSKAKVFLSPDAVDTIKPLDRPILHLNRYGTASIGAPGTFIVNAIQRVTTVEGDEELVTLWL